MKKTEYKYTIISIGLLIFFFSFFCAIDSYAQRTKSSQSAGEQRKAEKGIKDNKYFIFFIDPSVTNFGSEEEKKMFKEAAQRDFISQLLYFKFQFKDAYIEVRKAQKILIDLYRSMLAKDISMLKEMLNKIAPGVILSEDVRSSKYLELGYRDQRSAEILMRMADNYRESLYSMRLREYIKSMKNTKHGKRYAILSMIENSLEQEEKIKERKYDFSKIMSRIEKYPDSAEREYYARIHLDNYFKTKDTNSLYDMFWENPELLEIKEYEHYLNRAD